MAFAAPAAAENFAGCTAPEAQTAATALRQAKDLTLKAAARVGETAEYERWFGDYSDRNAETVRKTLKSLIGSIRGGGVVVRCDANCNPSEFAWVYPNQPFVLHLCSAFFDLPPLTALQPGARQGDNGTREGTIVHEMSHFRVIGDTEDHCYSRSDCARMARRDAGRAIDNADSYQYFTEDVTYYARQPVPGKPLPRSGN